MERVIIVTRPTELDNLVARFNTVPQAKFYIQQAGQDFSRIEIAHASYKAALATIRQSLPSTLKQQVLPRDLVSRYTFDAEDVVVIVGQDGLVSNTAKYLDGQTVIGVNPIPDLYDGVLLPFRPEQVAAAIAAIDSGRMKIRNVTLAEARTSDGQTLLAFNDFFIGARSHVSARYEICHDGRVEIQSSSGVIVSTGAGSTGWLKSVYKGAANIISALGGMPPQLKHAGALPWDFKGLVFVVREPFPSKATGADIGHGIATKDAPLVIRSRMSTEGVIFSDGVEDDFIAFNTGNEVMITLANRVARLAVGPA